MGLDTVELVIAIEDEFGIHIDNEDAASLTTPGEVTDFVLTRVRMLPEDNYLVKRGFYEIRKILINEFSIEKKNIKPSTKIVDLLGDDLKSNWQSLHAALRVDHFPILEPSRQVYYFFILVPPLIVTSSVFLIFGNIVASIVLFLFLMLLGENTSTVYGSVVPKKYNLVSDLIPFVSTSSDKVWSRQEILNKIIEITSEQLGVPVVDIKESSKFVQDLGAD
jgi:acyl carrier protein